MLDIELLFLVRDFNTFLIVTEVAGLPLVSILVPSEKLGIAFGIENHLLLVISLYL